MQEGYSSQPSSQTSNKHPSLGWWRPAAGGGWSQSSGRSEVTVTRTGLGLAKKSVSDLGHTLEDTWGRGQGQTLGWMCRQAGRTEERKEGWMEV